MKQPGQFILSFPIYFRVGIFGVIASLAFLGFRMMTVSLAPFSSILISLAVGLLLAFGLDRLIDLALLLYQNQQKMVMTVQRVEQDKFGLQARLECLLQLNNLLATTYNERELIESVLILIEKTVGAIGASFVPIDEFGQLLPAFVHGDIPEPDLHTWTEYLSSPDIKDRCRACVDRFAPPESSCPLLKLPLKEQVKVECLAVKRDERILGMLNLYLPLQATLDADNRIFLLSILDEIALAVDALHLHNQEVSTLRQLQMLRSSLLDLETSLTNLLPQVLTAFEAGFAVLLVQTSTENKPRLILRQNFIDQIPENELNSILMEVLDCGETLTYNSPVEAFTNAQHPLSMIAAPLKMADRPVVGAIMVGSEYFQAFNPGQMAALQMVASQAALLIEHNRMMVDLEYKVVIKERTRLAREIHDGIAQLLAFLKLQTGQMQTFVSQGQVGRLEQALKANYQALSEAYLATRQTIDDLRLTPKDGLRQWLEQIASDFQNSTGLIINLTITPDIHKLPDEVQLQLIRITQEAISNIRKHARASTVTLSAMEWENDFILEIQDDGEGFSPGDIPGISQYGLRGMRERTELIGAEFQIISQPHKGTNIKVSMPIPMEEPQR
jgi:two-component system, NarL family, nitrate/nitrite sensor histidine kinase NarX